MVCELSRCRFRYYYIDDIMNAIQHGGFQLMSDGTHHSDGPNIQGEKRTVERMIRFYCQKKHGSDGHLCGGCTELLDYSHNRLTGCRYGEEKPTCRKCPVHCYKPDMRQQIRTVMRFSGPRLALRAPLVWVRHQFHDRKDVD
ncbi:MAG: nitrous oxide-stimulated promoter family protein [Candidatus Thorarchaeota archaeon]|jgi:hypothetical protein